MKIAFLAPTAHELGGTANAVVTQANALCGDHDVTILSLYRGRRDTHYDVDRRVRVRDLVDTSGRRVRVRGVSARTAAALRDRDPLVVGREEDPTLDALADVALERALPRLDADVLVTTTPALLAHACRHAPPRTAIVHQEHRSSSQRVSSRHLLLRLAPQTEAVVMLTEPMVTWLRAELGPAAPEVLAIPNALPAGPRPRSPLTDPVVVSGGRLVGEKQFPQLVAAFAQVADRLPGWRLRIFGDGPARGLIAGTARKLGVADRVELPGVTRDLPDELARASVMALTSQTEAFPLVLQEAMGAGLAVVSYDMPSGARAQVDDGVDGLLVTPGSVPGLAAALLRLATDEPLRHRLGEAALTKAATAWNQEAVTARWVEVYERAVTRRRGVRSRGRTTAVHARRVRDGDAGAPPPGRPPAGAGGRGVTPLEARTRTFEVAVEAARAAAGTTAPWFVVPPHGASAPEVVLPADRRRAFLEAVGRTPLPPWLSLHDPEHRGWPSRRGTAAEMLPPLLRGRTARLLLEPWPQDGDAASLLGHECEVAVQFWEPGPDGDLHNPERGTYTPVLSVGTALVEREVLGIPVPVHPVMAEPTVADCTFDVDVVYTWVDGADPDWEAARQRRLDATDDATMRSPAASGPARYLDRDELRYSMRGVHLFAPWVRTIHVVTAGQVPAWLDTDHPQVHLVDHREILPADALPTFNSHAIEAALHRIDDLAEHFLYLNDDVFLARPTVPEAWFTGAGATRVFPSHTTVGLAERDLRPWQLAARNNSRLLERTFGRTIDQALKHSPYAHRRSVLAEVEERFAAEVAATVRAPFRSATDVSVMSSLAPYYGLATGTAVVGDLDSLFVDLTDAIVPRHLRGLLQREHAAFCLGEGEHYARDPEEVATLVADFLRTYFPIAAPWER